MIRALTTAILLATATAAFADGHFDRTLSVGAAPDLYVSTGSGRIKIFPSNDGQVHIAANLRASHGWGGADRNADERIRQIVANPPIVQSGNSIHVGETNDRELYNSIAIDYDIAIPANAALNLRSGSGDVEVDHIGRFVAATSGSGSVRIHGAHGPADLRSGSGDIELQEEGAGDVKAQTGSGSIRVNGFSGSLSARTGSGDIEGNGRLTGSAHLVSGSGSVRMNLPSDAHFNIEASTGSGSIRVHFPNAPEQDSENRHHLTGAINGGGAPLEVRTGSGDIEVNSGYRN